MRERLTIRQWIDQAIWSTSRVESGPMKSSGSWIALQFG